MKELQFVFFEGISFTSKLIRKITGSRFSHVAYYNKYEDLLIECWTADDLSIKDFLSLHPIDKFNNKYAWKYSKLSNHTKGTPYYILTKAVSNEIFELVDLQFKFLAEYSIPYDILGLLGRLNSKFNTKYGMYCSEGVQNILTFVSKYKNLKNTELTDLSIPGYKTDPGKLYYVLKSCGYKLYKEDVT
jgi:hypothetical protein